MSNISLQNASNPESVTESSSEEPPSSAIITRISEPEEIHKPGGSLLKTIRTWVLGTLGISSISGEILETIEEAVEDSDFEKLVITPEGKKMLHNIIAFFELRVSDVMIPRVNIVAVEEKMSLSEIKEIARINEHTRMPVFRESLDNVTGFVHIKDLFNKPCQDSEFELARYVRKALIVPPSMRVMDLLVKMRLSGVHIAIVVDEFGGTDGLITLEDIFEEIVGEIQDEHDEQEESQHITRVSDTEFEADARLEIENLEKFLGREFDNDEEREFDTLGGMIFEMLGRVPSKGEKINNLSGMDFEILDADSRRIKKVRAIIKSGVEA